MDVCIRITTNVFTKEQILDGLLFKEIDVEPHLVAIFDKIIVAEEMATQRHFHVFGSYIGEQGNGNNWARPLKRHIAKTFNITGTEFSVSKPRTENAAAYTVKDNNFIQRGYLPELIEKWQEQSYQKPESYKARKKTISQQYVNFEINTEEFLTQQIQLMCEFDVAYNRNNFIAYARTQAFKRNPDKIAAEITDLQLQI